MLRWRLILGTLLIASLVGLCWLDYRSSWPGIYLLPVAVVLSLLGAGELLEMFRKRGHEPAAWVVYAGTAVTVLFAAAPGYMPSSWMNAATGRLGWLAIGLAAALLIVFVGELRRFESPGRATKQIALSCFAIMYVGGLMGFVVQLRLLGGGPWGDDGHWGMLALASLIATVKMSDTGQYTFGRLFGRHKLSPIVSPGKTWEGAAGGFVFAIIAVCVVFGWAARYLVGVEHSVKPFGSVGGILTLVTFAAGLTAAGILGDLAESLLKRDAGVKDSSTWLPGFGGVLDLLDSLLGAAPAAYALWALGLVGPLR
jgi:phosphatidate cytidylyltransferase